MSITKSEAVQNVERAESMTPPLQIGMFLSNSQLKRLANFANNPDFSDNKPDGIMIRVGVLPEKFDFKHSIEIIPYKNNFDENTKFEDPGDEDFNKLIRYFEFEKKVGYLDIELGYPEQRTHRFPLGKKNGSTLHNKYKINNDENYGGGGGGPSQTYPRPGSNGNT